MSSRHPGGDRKQLQLAAQIGRSVEATLIGVCHDDVLNNTSVEKVEPAPGHRMLVTLMVHAPGALMPKEDVLARLEAHRGTIVANLARDVARRGLPELSFWLVRDPDAPAADPVAEDQEDEDWDPPSILDD